MEPSWGYLGAILAQLGATSEPSRGHLGPSWALLGHLGAILGPSWGYLRPSWGHPGPSWAIKKRLLTQDASNINLKNKNIKPNFTKSAFFAAIRSVFCTFQKIKTKPNFPKSVKNTAYSSKTRPPVIRQNPPNFPKSVKNTAYSSKNRPPRTCWTTEREARSLI